jgi:ribonucleotide monophosphatase NagD (HAD superfamily)
MKDYEYRDNNGNPIDYYTVVNDATMMLRELNEKDKQIDQLTNNWNELEEWVKQRIDKVKYNSYDDVLDKMKEIKGDNK